jgi:TPP-dependent indolepyruvate ferredoxin oxidoreductase alpha subunit
MNERKRILEMLGDGKITAEEAEKLLDALKSRENPTALETVELKDKRGRKPTKLRVNIDSKENSKKAKVNVSIPIALIRTLGPFYAKNLPKEAKEELDKNEVSVIIARKPCIMLDKGKKKTYKVNAKCVNCKMCLKLGCPALNSGEKKAEIDKSLCAGCGLCLKVCKMNAIEEDVNGNN